MDLNMQMVSTQSDGKVEQDLSSLENVTPKAELSVDHLNSNLLPRPLPKTAVLLVNLGTPDGTDYKSMRRYLSEFLSDRRVIEWPRAIWLPILHGIVLMRRPYKSGAAYETIWNHEQKESPLRTFTREQSNKLAQRLKDHDHIIVDWAMRYGNPSIESITNELMAQGCERIVMFPLYPQYSASTTATVNDKFFDALKKMRSQPAVRTVPSYYNDPSYINALANSIEQKLSSLDHEPEVVIASYHGIPVSYSTLGDPYKEECLETTRLLRLRLGWDEKKLISCFQSRFGPEEWLQPYTDKTVDKLAQDGVKSIAVFNPGFVADCLETLEEIAVEASDSFKKNGGTNFTFIPCLNASDDGMDVIETIVRQEISGWV